MDSTKFTGLEVAIIGYAGRVTGCSNVREYWEALYAGKETITVFDKAQLDELGIPEQLWGRPDYVKANGELPDKDCFDAEFWGYTPDEAAVMDPQMRIFHECVWEALEMAGYSPGEIKANVGLYAGASNSPLWQSIMMLRQQHGMAAATVNYLSDREFLCSRIAYKLNFKGPAVFIHTACSSSLVAVHNACRGLLTGDCEIAVAGGVSASLLEKGGYLYAENMILSSDGHCRAFDAEADGTVRGEGAGVVILKKYARAIADGDTIHGIIRGSAINNDGNEKVGYTAPGIDGQSAVIRKALKIAQVAPEEVSYIETHGTGTRLGDPIEIAALKTVFDKVKTHRIPIGSVKTNIGHLDAAAGIAGLIKVLLMLKYKKVPASLFYRQPNPKIDFDATPFYVNNELREWEGQPGKRIAGISSFGIGGTNAHLIVEEFLGSVPVHKPSASELVNVSAKSMKALHQTCSNLARDLQESNDADLSSFAYTLNSGRQNFRYRKSFLAATKEQAIRLLTDHHDAPVTEVTTGSFNEGLVFVFSGQGAQYPEMAKGLYDTLPLFKHYLDECFNLIREQEGIGLAEIIFPGSTVAGAEGDLMSNTCYTQLALFAVSYSLSRVLMDWGLRPSALIGHSIGEYVCACLAGVTNLPATIRIITERGRLMQSTAAGEMYYANMAAAVLEPLLPEELSIAAINGKEESVISGGPVAMGKFVQQLEGKGIAVRKLKTSHAFHSALMEPVIPVFVDVLRTMSFQSAQIPYISNVTGDFVPDIMDAAYFGTHLRATVRFSEGIEKLLTAGKTRFLEVGPGAQLAGYINRLAVGRTDVQAWGAIRQAKNPQQDVSYLFQQLSECWKAGAVINWEKVYEKQQRSRIPLSGHVFEKLRFPFRLDIGQMINMLQNFQGQIAEPAARIVTEWFYQPVWKQVTQKTADQLYNEICLIFSDGSENTRQLISRLTQNIARVIVVETGREFQQVTDTLFRIAPDDDTHYQSLFRELSPAIHQPLHIVHTYLLGDMVTAYITVEEGLSAGYISLTNIARAIDKAGWSTPVSISVLATKTAAVENNEEINPLKNTVLGAVKVIPLEYLSIRCKMMDIPAVITPEVYDILLYELMNGKEEEVFIAIRGHKKYLHTQEHVKISTKAEAVTLRTDGCYMITGGFGGMGYTIATDLATTDKANLVLVTRTAFPERNQWQQWLETHDATDDTSIRIRDIMELEGRGANIMVAYADVSDEAAMQKVVTRAKETFGSIRGVVWAAGVIDYGGVIQKRSAEDFIVYIQAKVHGLLLLQQLIDFRQLDLLVLFSSMGNVLYQSKFGQVAYCAANEFLEAFPAYAARQFNIRVKTINWNDWRDVGMSVKALKKARKTEDISKINALQTEAISPAEGVEIFRACLQSDINNLYLSTTDLGQSIDKMRAVNAAEKNLDFSRITTGIKYKRPSLSQAYEAPVTETEQILEKSFGSLFGFEKVGIDDNFFELGGDSLKAMAILIKIEQDFQRKISLETFFSHPCIRELARVINDRRPAEERHNGQLTDNSKNIIPLSPGQKRMYLLNSLDNRSVNYNQLFCFRMPEVDRDKLQHALDVLVTRHDILRTSFGLADKEVVQQVASKITVVLQEEEIAVAALADKLQTLKAPFDLSVAPMFRTGILHFTDDQDSKIVWVDIHHIIADGLSNQVILYELFALYLGQELPVPESQYRDYISYIMSPSVTAQIIEEKAYWLSKLSGELPELNLYSDYPRPKKRSYQGDNIILEINEPLRRRLSEFITRHNSSGYIFSVSLVYLLLWKLTGQQDILVGITAAGRSQERFLKTIGMFINTLVTRFSFEERGSVTYLDFFNSIKKEVLQSVDHQLYPFEDLISELGAVRTQNRNPVFDVLVSSESAMAGNELNAFDFGNSEVIQPLEVKRETSNFDLRISVAASPVALSYVFEYSSALYSKSTIQRYATYFERILHAVLDDPAIKIAEIELAPAAEREMGIQPVDQDFTFNMVDVITENFSRFGGRPAMIHNGQMLTYEALGAEVNKLAGYLRSSGIKPGDIVALYLDPGADMLISILGVLKAGAAFLPIDPDMPPERFGIVITDARPVMLLTNSAYYFDLTDTPCKLFAIDIQLGGIKPVDLPEVSCAPDALAYVIYTSGSTGQPKGVQICHRNLSNYVSWFLQEFNLSEMDSTPLLTSYSFDLGYTSVFPVLVAGGTLHMVDKPFYMTPRKLLTYLFEHKITYLKLTPSLFSLLVNYADMTKELLVHLKYILLGGEMIRFTDVEKYLQIYSDVTFVNHYGPTETTIGVVFQRIRKDNINIIRHRCVIGKPITNVNAYIMDAGMNTCPVGVIGELCFTGKSVGAGYLNGATASEEKFVSGYATDSLLYRTGDMARWLPDGTIEFLGRIDTQIKIRGFRIDPAEIVNALLRYPGISEAVVVPYEESVTDTSLAAYYVATDAISYGDIRTFLRNILPDYYIPAYFTQLVVMPLNANNKIDIKSLPVPENKPSGELLPPSSELEKQLISIWADVLEIEPELVGINRGFFELGGNSLKVVKMVSEIARKIGVEVPVVAIFEHPTVGELANGYIQQAAVETKAPQQLHHAKETLRLIKQINASLDTSIN